jgi:monooxygenase
MNHARENVIIIGAGLAGICAARYMADNGISYRILEKSDRVGGIWSALNWPGIRCDTEILNYSYSFRPLLSQRNLVPGAAIAEYLDSTANELGISDNIHFNTRVISAEFSTREHCWRLQTSQGDLRADFIINTNGYFDDRPHVPEFSGQEAFAGEIKHLFDIDQKEDFSGKSLILVGSGASAISAAPALYERCRSLTLLQRSPSYIYEDDNRIGWFSDWAQRLYRAGVHFPIRIVNALQQSKSDLIFVSFRKFPALGKWFFRHHWRDCVDRDNYRKHFEPLYNPWEQRIPVAIGFKALLGKAGFQLVTSEIDCFTNDGVRLTNGKHIKADVCVLATGFNLKFFRFKIKVDGESIDTRGINFYKGMMMGGIPNYFQPFGPPHTSFTRRIETISGLIVKIIRHMRKHELQQVSIARKTVPMRPRITPNYVLRNLTNLPAFYGSLELPSIDNLLFFRFRPKSYQFDGDDSDAPDEVQQSPALRSGDTPDQVFTRNGERVDRGITI